MKGWMGGVVGEKNQRWEGKLGGAVGWRGGEGRDGEEGSIEHQGGGEVGDAVMSIGGGELFVRGGGRNEKLG